MKKLTDLQLAVRNGLQHVTSHPGVIEAVVYASSNRRTVGRLVYTSHIPSNGLEEPKSDEDFGITVELWLDQHGKQLLGVGHEANEISIEGVSRALKKAVRDAVEDPDFEGFLKPDLTLPTPVAPAHVDAFADRDLLDLTPEREADVLAKLSWETIAGAASIFEPYAKKHGVSPDQLAFILNGDNFLIQERMALATTNGINDAEESTVILSFLTAMLERQNSKGSAWGGQLQLSDYSAFDVGKRAALAAINGVGGTRVKSGKYNVVFGPQATTELFASLLLPHANLGLVDFGASIFNGKFGQQVASPLLTLYDDATLPLGPGSKRITCEGCPTGKTMLIDQGKLVGYLSDYRTTRKVLKKREESGGKLGVDPHEIRHAISPRNGFRFSDGGGRVASTPVGIHATNLIIDTSVPMTEGELLKKAGDGIYIGRLWYTYPVGGYASGIISGTAVADSYIIRDGKLAEPILPNTLRLEDNIASMIKRILGIARNQIPTILWASDEITHAPWIAMEAVNFNAICES